MPEEKDKKIVLQSASDSSIKPSDFTRMAPAAAAETESRKLKTIKLKPLRATVEKNANEEETISMNREDITVPPFEEKKETGEEDATVKIQKQEKSFPQAEQMPTEDDSTIKISRAETAPPQEEDSTTQIHKTGTTPPPIPGVKQTIKLRPSSSSMAAASAPEASEPAPTTLKGTLKLTPPTSPPADNAQIEEDSTAQIYKVGAPPSSAGGQSDAPKRTIKLMAKKPSDPTVKVDLPVSESAPSSPTMKVQQDAEGLTSVATNAPKKTLKLKTHSAPPPPVPAESAGMATEHGIPPAMDDAPVSSQQYPSNVQETGKEDETSAITTIAASIALMVLGYLTYVLASQYTNLFM